jgi:hypothetical protein
VKQRSSKQRSSSPPLISIGLISASALACEILLMRLLSITQWHHFAYMIISLALLGYGVSGTFLALAQNRLKGHFRVAFITCAALFGITSVGCFLVVQSLPFNALEILWDHKQPLWLLAIYLLLFIPFFCAANCICLALFSEFPGQLHRIYSFDLLGAGFGAIGMIGLLFVLEPMTALKVIGGTGLLSALIASWECRIESHWLRLALLTADRHDCIVAPGHDAGTQIVRIQRPQPGTAGDRRRTAGPTIQPAWAVDHGCKPHGSVPACPRYEPERASRTAGTVGNIHRRRRYQRDNAF